MGILRRLRNVKVSECDWFVVLLLEAVQDP